MSRRTFLAMTFATLSAAAFAAQNPDTRCFEMRVYYANPGKLDSLHQRFRAHTLRLFAKHGMTSLGYFTPLDNADNKLIFFLAYPSRQDRETAWKAFLADPAWQAAAKASEATGPLIAKMENHFLQLTDFSPKAEATKAAPRIFELRTYTTTPGNLDALLTRFRDHTTKLFAKHGMTNLPYWTLQPGQPGAENTLLYLLAHKDPAACKASFTAFRADPDWISARTASEANAGGSLTIEGGVKSELLQATDYSPIQ